MLRERPVSWKDYNKIAYTAKDFREDLEGVHTAIGSNVIDFPRTLTLINDKTAKPIAAITPNTTKPFYKASMYFVRKYGERSAPYLIRYLAINRFVVMHSALLIKKGLVKPPKLKDGPTWVAEDFGRYLLRCRLRGRFGRIPKSAIEAFLSTRR
jgi:hypothetical protein